MATLTKTFTETDTTLPRKSWTIALTGTNQTVSGNFTLTAPTMTAKTSLYASKTGYTPQNLGSALVDMYFNVGGSIRFQRGGYEDATYVTGTTYTLSREMVDLSITLSNVFNSSNRTSKTASVIAYSDTWEIGFGSVSYNASQAMYWHNDYSNQSKYTWGTIATLTLNAPPSVANGTPSYSLPYAGLGEYSVSVTSASAKYSGYLLSLTLTIGTQTKTLNFTNQTSVTNQTLTLTPNVAGTFTPTITATDSRGQTKSVSLPQITVNPYLVPSVNFNVFRVNDNAIRDDEGHLCLIDANISYTDAVATLTEPSVKIDGIDIAQQTGASIAWYTNWDNTSGVSGAISDWSALTPTNSRVHVYGLIDWDYDVTGKFAEDKSYQITLIGNDSLGGTSSAITQTLSTAFYTIDFQAGGKEIVFGGPAKDDLTNYPNGLFKCEMDIIGRGFLDYFYPVGSYYETSDVTFNPNTKWGGTWVLETEGQVHVSAGANYTAGNTGGSKYIQAHTHGFTRPTVVSDGGGHTHTVTVNYRNAVPNTGSSAQPWASGTLKSTGTAIIANNTGTHNHSLTGGSVGAVSGATTGNADNMPPYIVVNRWHRTA